jgi:hypothetical protein
MYTTAEYENMNLNVSASDYIRNKQQMVRYTQSLPMPSTFKTYEERNALWTQYVKNQCRGPCLP